MIHLPLDEALRRASRDDEAPDSTVTTESVLSTVVSEAPPRHPTRWGIAALVLALLCALPVVGHLKGGAAAPPATPSPTPSPTPDFTWHGGNPTDQPMSDELALSRCPARTGEKVWAERSNQVYGGQLSFVPVGATPAPDDYEQPTRDCPLGYDRTPTTARITKEELAAGSGDGYLRLCSKHSGLDMARAGLRPLGSARGTISGLGGQDNSVVAVFRDSDGWLVSCTGIIGEALAWLDFQAALNGASVCQESPLHVAEVTQDLRARSRAVAVSPAQTAAVMEPGVLEPDTRVSRVRITAGEPWGVDLTRPVFGGVMVSAGTVPLRKPVPLTDDNSIPDVPTTVRALDAKGRVLFTCRNP